MAITVLITFFLVVLIALAWAALSSGADRTAAGPSANSRAQRSEVASRATAPDHCRSAREGLAFYRGRYSDWRALRAAETPYPVGRKPTGCADARQLAKVWKGRSLTARRLTGRWLRERTLRDFRVTAGASAWLRAIEEAQKVYPGTESWLRSCSASEGGHGRWVPNSQGSGVGGWLQFYPSTWSGFFYRSVSVARSQGFRVPKTAHSWYSPLGQALAGAWAITHGMRHHWVGQGC